MFSCTVRSPYSPKRCAMYPIWSLTARDSCWTSWPATRALPPVGCISPQSIRRVVVFPAPSGPTRPKISPRAIVRSRWSTAVSAPKRRVNPWISMMGASPVIASIQHDLRIRRHIGLQLALGILQFDLHPVHQLYPLLLRLNLLGRELGLRRDES